ncbi:MAG: amidohydrolase family protein [Actinomycetota bacterium]|nr:amidohydrolase family protein [Actinomycetota bacterium]
MMNRDWLDRRTEEAIEPDLEIVDPHHHLWDYETVYGRYDIDDLRIDTGSGHNVVETVFIDCGANYLTDGPEHLRPIGETRFVANRADATDHTPGARITAIVSRADLTLGSGVREVLEAHVAEAGGRFSGVRHSGASTEHPSIPSSRPQPPLDLYSDPAFREGAAVLADMGLSFEAWQYHYQLDQALALAQAVPALTVVVNHVGGPLGLGASPDQFEQILADTRDGLAPLAACGNVVLKVGGIAMARTGVTWHERSLPPSSDDVLDTWGDMLEWCLQTFGPSRCMFESNFPVDGETCGYGVLWNAFKKASAGYTTDERRDLFADTARRTYRI